MPEIIDAASALRLRREIYSKPAVSRADLARLIAAGRACPGATPVEFDDLLANVAVDLLVHQVDPPEYIQQGAADWLIAQLRDGAGLDCRAEYEMLVDVLRYAVSVPANLAAFAVAEIEKAIVQGHRTPDGAIDHPGSVVSAADVAALRVAVFAATDGSSLHVTRESAEALFRIAHAAAGAKNDAEFAEFFAKAVGNYLMGVAFHWTPSVGEEQHLEQWLDEKPSLGGFLMAMFGGRSGDTNLTRMDDERVRAENAADAAERASAETIDPMETKWIMDHLGRDGAVTSAELQLLRFLKREAPALPTQLEEILDKQAA